MCTFRVFPIFIRTLRARVFLFAVLLIPAAWIFPAAWGNALPAKGAYTIQVSSCKQQQSAVHEMDRLKKQGCDVFYRYERTKESTHWYRVYVGRYGSKEEALKEAEALKAKGSISEYRIRRIADPLDGDLHRQAPLEGKSEQPSWQSVSRILGSGKREQSGNEAMPGRASQAVWAGPPAKAMVQLTQASAEEPKTPFTVSEPGGAPSNGGGGAVEKGAAGRFDGTAPAGPGAGELQFKFQTPGKKEVPGKSPPATGEKQAPAGPFREKGKVLTTADIREMLLRHHFYSTCNNYNFDFCNPDGNFNNLFQDNGDGTVTDRASHLMWEKGGSLEKVTFLDALKYVQELNRKTFAGHADWRLPTIEELASLLEPSWKNEDLFIEKFFDARQRSCWSVDTQGIERAWSVDFHLGYVTDDPLSYLNWVRAVRSDR